MSKGFKKSISALLVGVTVLSSNAGVLQAKPTNSYTDTIVDRLEQMQGVKYSITDNTDYTYLFKNEYSLNVDCKVMSATDLGLKCRDYTKLTDSELKTLTENELFFLKSAYDYIVDFGCSYEYEKFFTYSQNELSLVEFDFYVYSLVQQYIKNNGAGANELAKNYADLLGIRECILNFSYVTAEFRESKIAELSSISWSKDAKFDKFRQ